MAQRGDGRLLGLRVLLAAQYASMGGTRTYFKQLIEFYGRHGADVTVARPYEGLDPEIDLLMRSSGFRSIPIEPVVGGTSRRGSIQWSRRSLEERFATQATTLRALLRGWKPDVTVVSTGDPGGLLGALATAPRGFYIVHTYPHGIRSSIFSRRAMPESLPVTAQVVTVSQFAKRRVLDEWNLEARVADVYCIYSTAGPTLESSDLAERCETVLTVGHVEPYKDPLGWIEVGARVLKRAPHMQTSFVWAGEGGLLTKCQRRVERLGLQDRIRFIGPVQDVAPLYRDCSVYFQPSQVESLGLGALDAIRRGIPCVVSDAGGLPEVVQDGLSGFVVRSDDAAASSIAGLLEDHEMRERMGDMARKRYARVFSPEAWDKGLLALHLGEVP
jgi:glycosyltransferase involved in cell wall biosynthesis